MLLSGVLLFLALFLAPEIQGTHRWFVIPGVASFQPSELAKISVILFLAGHIAAGKRRFLPDGWPVVAICLLTLLAPDLGTTVFLSGLACAMLLIAGRADGAGADTGRLRRPARAARCVAVPVHAAAPRFLSGASATTSRNRRWSRWATAASWARGSAQASRR